MSYRKEIEEAVATAARQTIPTERRKKKKENRRRDKNELY